jgi:hypothetical protein
MKLRAATFNIRNSEAPDGDNAWPVRRSATVAAIEHLDADVVGLQEVLPDQVDYLRWRFPRYEIVGVGRDDGMSAGEHCVVMVRHGDWRLERHETRWLSDDPGTPGSVGWDADLTLVDLAARRTINAADMASRCGWTPFEGMQATGWPMATVIRGRVVMREGEVLAPGLGEPVRFQETLTGR